MKNDLFAPVPERLSKIRKKAKHCRDCPLWRFGTQTVFGEGPESASVMFVGEQPGDKEDLTGKPFVGPAGKLLDKALIEAGIERRKTYVTNAVKHFKFVPRGKIRLHKKPNTSEIKACRQWFDRERDAIQPELIVALGATAVYSIFGKTMPINKNRGRFLNIEERWKGFITVHPSFLLRVRDEDREKEYALFLRDLRMIAKFIHVKRAA
jgi:DNA polymerase